VTLKARQWNQPTRHLTNFRSGYPRAWSGDAWSGDSATDKSQQRLPQGRRRVRLTTRLDAPADAVWRAVNDIGTFVHVARPFLAFQGAKGFPQPFRAGSRVMTRLLAFTLLPLWPYTVEFERVDGLRRTLTTNEHGGPIRVWRHTIKVKPHTDSGCTYADEVDIDAGLLTLPVWLFAEGFYRHRQRRWRTLARSLMGK
jgi:hypothetical protein